MSAALDPLHNDRVPGASLAAGTLDVAGVALCQRWCVMWGLVGPAAGSVWFVCGAGMLSYPFAHS